MNAQLQAYARQTIKEGLAQLPDGAQLLFKRMYAHGRLEMPINEVVDQMPEDRLDWAMQQVERTLAKQALQKEDANG